MTDQNKRRAIADALWRAADALLEYDELLLVEEEFVDSNATGPRSARRTRRLRVQHTARWLRRVAAEAAGPSTSPAVFHEAKDESDLACRERSPRRRTRDGSAAGEDIQAHYRAQEDSAADFRAFVLGLSSADTDRSSEA